MSQAPAVAAGRTYLEVDGRVVAQAVAFSCSMDPGLYEEYGLDDVEPAELGYTVVRIRGSIGLVRRVGDGGADGLGLGAPSDLLTRKKYSSMSLVDVGLKRPVFSWEGAILFGNESWQMVAKGQMAGAVTFTATSKWLNEVTGA